MKRRMLLLAIAMLALALFARAAPSAEPGPAIGLHAGVDDSTAQYERFGEWLGRKVLYRVVFCDAGKWDGIAHPWFLDASARWVRSDPRRWEVLSVPLLPENEKGNFRAIIDGRHDVAFRSLGEELSRRGVADRAVIRLGWEFNGDWFAWSAVKDPAGYREAFRRAVGLIRAAAPRVKIDWCANRGSSGGMHWTDAYPGDDAVDVVSMDVYDQYYSSWDEVLKGDAGLQALREFARAHRKPEAYPEWGCSTDAHGHGDSPEFIDRLADWFAAAPGRVLYQGYWNTAAGGPNAALFGDDAGRVPKAAAAYRRRFGKG